MVWRCRKRLQEGRGSSHSPNAGGPKSKRTPETIRAVASKIRRNPARSMNKMAKVHNLSRGTMQTIVKSDLGHHPYKMRRRQLLSEATRTKRLQRSKLLKAWHAANPDVVVIYSDEKVFPVTKALNHQNDRVLSKDSSTIDSSIRDVYRVQGPASIMTWAAVASNGQKSPIFSILDGVKINQHTYLDFLENQVKPWVEKTFPGTPVCFTQDGAPAHTARIVQEWCKNNFDHFWTKEMWPPSSPDLNPLDFAM